MNKQKIVMEDSDKAAKQATVTGWVSRLGHFYTDERMARYDGCTHRPCDSCGAPTERCRISCESCRDKKDVEKYKAMPKQLWDGSTYIYSESADEYFDDSESIADKIFDSDRTLDSMRFVICEPVYAKPVESDYWEDELPEDGDLPAEIEAALDVLNAVISKCGPISWMPGEYAADMSNFADEINEMCDEYKSDDAS